MEEQPDRPLRRARWRLAGTGGTVATAREHTRCFLDDGTPRPATAVQDALILVSELASNAVRHAPGPCTLELTDDGTALTIAVSDSSTDLPQPRPADLESGGGGFGWHLLERLARRLDVRVDPRVGKTVTATLAGS
jgi:anti-sigma regulatory factor (Ser/Thr protein kinase)